MKIAHNMTPLRTLLSEAIERPEHDALWLADWRDRVAEALAVPQDTMLRAQRMSDAISAAVVVELEAIPPNSGHNPRSEIISGFVAGLARVVVGAYRHDAELDRVVPAVVETFLEAVKDFVAVRDRLIAAGKLVRP